MNKAIYIAASICLVMLVSGPVSGAERDPFAPYIVTTDVKAKSQPVKEMERTVSADFTDLDNHPVSSYKLIGVVISKQKSLALIRNVSKQDFFLEVGDAFGQEQGVIKAINIDNVLVDLDEREIILTVKNKMEEPKDEKNR